MFLGERNAAPHASGLASVYYNNNNNNHNHNRNYYNHDRSHSSIDTVGRAARPHQQLTPPDDYPITGETMMDHRQAVDGAGAVLGWMEIWDYAGGSSFRGFVAEDTRRNTTTMFVFFDAHTITRDLRQACVCFPSCPVHHHHLNLLTRFPGSLLSLSWPRALWHARTWLSASSAPCPRRKAGR